MNETLELAYASMRSTENPGLSIGNSPLELEPIIMAVQNIKDASKK